MCLERSIRHAVSDHHAANVAENSSFCSEFTIDKKLNLGSSTVETQVKKSFYHPFPMRAQGQFYVGALLVHVRILCA